jgi:endonuclease YncB( thermonuclease family)
MPSVHKRPALLLVGAWIFACMLPSHGFVMTSARLARSPPYVDMSKVTSRFAHLFEKKGGRAEGCQPQMHLSASPKLSDIGNAAWIGTLSFAVVGMVLLSPATTDAAELDLSHSPLAKSKVNFVVEGRPRVVDGDTLVFEDRQGQKERVRMLGIDAPESKQMCTNKDGKDYACGVEAKAYLQAIIGDDPVQCLAAKRDQYNRVLGVCFDERTGKELNEAMVVGGEAVAYVQFSKAYVTDEVQASSDHKGLWQGTFQKPWEYRKMKRSKSPPSTIKAPQNYVVGENRKVNMAKSEFELPEEVLDVDDAE